jgi:hypothetical protein
MNSRKLDLLEELIQHIRTLEGRDFKDGMDKSNAPEEEIADLQGEEGLDQEIIDDEIEQGEEASLEAEADDDLELPLGKAEGEEILDIEAPEGEEVLDEDEMTDEELKELLGSYNF